MGKVYRAQKDPNKAKKQAIEDENKVLPSSPLSDAAMERLAQIMNDSPTIVKLQGTEWEIRALKPGTQWMIAEEACKIVKGENLSMGDVIKEFAINIPSVARVITLSLLNDKNALILRNTNKFTTSCFGETMTSRIGQHYSLKFSIC